MNPNVTPPGRSFGVMDHVPFAIFKDMMAVVL
jgi:hypothetical protein